jgi:hypothetical protein
MIIVNMDNKINKIKKEKKEKIIIQIKIFKKWYKNHLVD